MPLPDRTKVTASNHSCSVRLDTSTNSIYNAHIDLVIINMVAIVLSVLLLSDFHQFKRRLN